MRIITRARRFFKYAVLNTNCYIGGSRVYSLRRIARGGRGFKRVVGGGVPQQNKINICALRFRRVRENVVKYARSVCLCFSEVSPVKAHNQQQHHYHRNIHQQLQYERAAVKSMILDQHSFATQV